jgi:hypothetical protein
MRICRRGATVVRRFITGKEDAMRLKGIPVIGAVAAGALGSVATASAASSAAVCVKKNGAVRFVTAKAKCRKGERRVNLQGKPGATGAQGPTGPAGAPGATGAQGKPGLVFLAGSTGTFTPTFGVTTGVSFTLSKPGRVLIVGSANATLICSPGTPQIGWVLSTTSSSAPVDGSQVTPPSGAHRVPLTGVTTTLQAGTTYTVMESAGCTSGGTIQGGSSIGPGSAWVFLLDE